MEDSIDQKITDQNVTDQKVTDEKATDQKSTGQETAENESTDQQEKSSDKDYPDTKKVFRSKYTKLKGTAIDMSEMPESVWVDEKKNDFIRIVGIRFGDYGKVYDFETRGLKLKSKDHVVIESHDRGLRMGWVAKSPVRLDNSELKLRLPEVTRLADESDFARYEKQESMEKRGIERATDAANRLNLKMTVLNVEYTLDCRKATVYFAAEGRVDFRNLLRELVHDMKAKVDLRQVGARDQTKAIGAVGLCGEETCCSRFIDKFHGVSIKMAKDQNLSLKPTKVSGMCGRLKCCLAYEYQDYVEGAKTVPKVGKCVKCKSGGCGVVKDVDIPRQTVLVEMEDGVMAVLPASEVVEDRTLRQNQRGSRNRHAQEDNEGEKLVATTDTDGLVEQIASANSKDVETKGDEAGDDETSGKA